MNILSLRFYSQELEHEYLKEQAKIRRKLQDKQKWLLIPFLIFQIVMRAIRQNWLSFTILLICQFLYILNLKCISKNANLRDLLLFLFLLLYSFFFPFNSFFKLNDQYYYSSSIDGYFSAVFCLAVLNLLSYGKKQIALLTIYVFQLILSKNDKVELWEQIIYSGMQILLYSQYMYQQETIKRQMYIEQNKQKIMEENIQNYNDIDSFIINYNSTKNKLILIQKNRISQITEKLQTDFIDKIRNTKISQYESKRRLTQFASQELLDTSNLLTLEQFLYYVFTEKYSLIKHLISFSDQKVQDEQILRGYLYSESYTIKIVKLYSYTPCLLVLMVENKKENVIDQLNLRNKIVVKALDLVGQLFKEKIKPSLIGFQWIYHQKKNQKTNNIVIINKLLRKIHSNILKCYNDFQNIQDYFNINKEFQRCVIQRFNIRDFLTTIFQQMLRYYGEDKGIFFTIDCRMKDLVIKSDQRQLKQLFLNLISFILDKQNQEPNYIKIILQDDDNNQNFSQSFKIRIEYQGHNLTKQAINGLPILNPQTTSELKHNSQRPFDLQLPISLLIIRKIGPSDKLTLKQTKLNKNYLEFQIFNALEDQYNLLPIISFTPKDYIITTQSLARNYQEYFDQIPLCQLNSYTDLK